MVTVTLYVVPASQSPQSAIDGTTASISLGLRVVKLVAGASPANSTAVGSIKFVPTRKIVLPPVTGPLTPWRAVMVGEPDAEACPAVTTFNAAAVATVRSSAAMRCQDEGRPKMCCAR